MKITVSKHDLIHAFSDGSVHVITGFDQETGDRVTFVADWRPAMELYEAALATSEPVVAEVESWQVSQRIPVNDLGGQEPTPRFGRDENDMDGEGS